MKLITVREYAESQGLTPQAINWRINKLKQLTGVKQVHKLNKRCTMLEMQCNRLRRK
jgi:hypothetical protein